MRKKIKSLNFVDRSRFNEGVSFDAKYAILHFATNSNPVVTTQLSQAIKDSGFDPVSMYQYDGKKLKTIPLSSK